MGGTFFNASLNQEKALYNCQSIYVLGHCIKSILVLMFMYGWEALSYEGCSKEEAGGSEREGGVMWKN